jgi:hypothetical protein
VIHRVAWGGANKATGAAIAKPGNFLIDREAAAMFSKERLYHLLPMNIACWIRS